MFLDGGTSISDWSSCTIILDLSQHGLQFNSRCIRLPLVKSENASGGALVMVNLIPLKWNIFRSQSKQRVCHLSKNVDKASVIGG